MTKKKCLFPFPYHNTWASAWGKRLSRVIARCWVDEAFKNALITHPKRVMRAYGLQIPEGVSVSVHDGALEWRITGSGLSRVVHYEIPIPPKPDADEMIGIWCGKKPTSTAGLLLAEVMQRPEKATLRSGKKQVKQHPRLRLKPSFPAIFETQAGAGRLRRYSVRELLENCLGFEVGERYAHSDASGHMCFETDDSCFETEQDCCFEGNGDECFEAEESSIFESEDGDCFETEGDGNEQDPPAGDDDSEGNDDDDDGLIQPG